MKILQICKKMPVPTKDGEALAILNMSQLLIQQKAQLTLLALATQKHHGDLANLPAEIKAVIDYNQCTINTNFNGLAFLRSLIGNEAYTLYRFYNKKFEALIAHTLQQQHFDIVQLEGLYLWSYIEVIKKYSSAKIVLRAHNVEHHVWQNLNNNTTHFFKKMAYRFNANSLKTIEENSLKKVDAIVTISTADQAYFQQKHVLPIHNIPFGIDVEAYDKSSIVNSVSKSVTHNGALINKALTKIESPPSPKPISLSFIGSLDWLPNIEGLHWFIDRVWPAIHQKFPHIKFYIAGRNMQASIKNIYIPNVIIVGEVTCAKQFIAAHPIFIVPLLSGSGMRIKIIEAMALQAAVVSTPLGASGIQYTHQTNICIAETVVEFTASIITLIKNEVLRNKIAENGRQLVEKQYNNEVLSKSLINFYRTLSP